MGWPCGSEDYAHRQKTWEGAMKKHTINLNLALSMLLFLMAATCYAQLSDVRLAVHVQDASGSPIADAQVDLRSIVSYDHKQYQHHAGKTDIQGNFRYVGSEQAEYYKLTVKAKGFATSSLQWPSQGEQTPKEQRSLPLGTPDKPYMVALVTPFVNLRGFVCDPAAEGVPKANVIVSRAGVQIAHLRSDKKGYFVFHAMAGAYTVEISYPLNAFARILASEAVFADGETLTFRLQPGAEYSK